MFSNTNGKMQLSHVQLIQNMYDRWIKRNSYKDQKNYAINKTTRDQNVIATTNSNSSFIQKLYVPIKNRQKKKHMEREKTFCSSSYYSNGFETI